MKSRRNTQGILLDTSFILPTLGIDVGDEVKKILSELSKMRVELFYSKFSILEALWVAAKLMGNGSFEMDRFVQGLRSIERGGRYKEAREGHEIFKDALELYKLGHRDMIDNLLYGTSVDLGLKLLTLDAKLREFIQRKGLRYTFLSSNKFK